MTTQRTRALTRVEYEELDNFRYQIRRFLHFAESAAQQEGIEPRQYQALLAIKAMPDDHACTMGALAERLFLQPQSTVGLVDRMEERQLVARHPGEHDARKVIVALTKRGNDVLKRLSIVHREDLDGSGPQLAKSLAMIIQAGAAK